MSIRPYYDVWCDVEKDGCIGWEQQATSSTRRDAWRRAKACGWKSKRVAGKTIHVCPNCQKALS